MNPGEWIALAALLGTAGAAIIGLIRSNQNKQNEIQRLREDVKRISQLMRDNDKERQRDYSRMVAFDVEQAIPGTVGERLGKLIRRDRVD